MAVPKRKVSKARRDKRRSNNSKLEAPNMVKCPNCGEYNLDHRVWLAVTTTAKKSLTRLKTLQSNKVLQNRSRKGDTDASVSPLVVIGENCLN